MIKRLEAKGVSEAMTDFIKLNIELFNVSKQIAEKSNELETARSGYLCKKDEYERNYSMALLQIKTKSPDATQTDIKAEAICQTYQDKLNMRVAEAKYRRLVVELSSLNSMLETLREVSFNARAEAKLTATSY